MAVCLARRASASLARNPALGALAALIAVALPVGLAYAGRQAGEAIGPLLAEGAGPRSILLGPVISAALAGSALDLAAPREAAFGDELRAAPVARAELLLGLTVAPVAVAGALFAVAAAAATVPFAAELPAGPWAACAILGVMGAAFVLGAAAAEAAVAIFRGSLWGLAGAATLAGLALLAPVEAASHALGSAGAVPEAVARSAAAALVAAAVCFALAVSRPEPRRARTLHPLLPVPSGAFAAAFVCALKRYARRRELLPGPLAGLVFAFAGAALAARSGAPAETLVLLSAGVAVLGASVFPLAAYGLGRAGRWLTRTAPAPVGRTAVADAGAALVLLLLTAGLAVAPLALATGAALVLLAQLGLVTVLTGATGLLAGVLVPWRGDRLGDQLAAFGAFLAVGTGLSLVVGAVSGPALAVLPEPVFAAAVAIVPLSAGLVLTAAAARRGA